MQTSIVLATIGLLAVSKLAAQTEHLTLGYRSCGTGQTKCHVSDGNWWKADAHSSTVNDVKRKKSKSMQMARLYGMNPVDYLKGNSRCADCHGEVVSGRENRNMNTGVSCENCHGPSGPEEGPGAGYFKIHQVGKPSADPLDTSREGYQKALQVGLVELRNVDVRAETCVRCHYINEKKLLEAGHPSGDGFDYVTKGIKNNISKHWDYKVRAIDLNETPYKSSIEKRGPIPDFQPKTLTASAEGGGKTKTIIIYRGDEVPEWLNPDSNVSLQPFNPKITEDTPIDSILIMIQERIKLIHAKIRGRDE